MQFTGEQLSDPDLWKIWKAYDTTGDGKMDREELAFLMEDLCEVKLPWFIILYFVVLGQLINCFISLLFSSIILSTQPSAVERR